MSRLARFFGLIGWMEPHWAVTVRATVRVWDDHETASFDRQVELTLVIFEGVETTSVGPSDSG